jgi:hypothetical protein
MWNSEWSGCHRETRNVQRAARNSRVGLRADRRLAAVNDHYDPNEHNERTKEIV